AKKYRLGTTVQTVPAPIHDGDDREDAPLVMVGRYRYTDPDACGPARHRRHRYLDRGHPFLAPSWSRRAIEPPLPTPRDIYNADQAPWATLGSVGSSSRTEGGQSQKASQTLPNLGTHI